MIRFVRHAESTANAGGVTMEHAAIPLSDLGRVQAATLAEILVADVQPERVLTSKYLRAIETARLFCEATGCQPEVHPLLHEFSTLDATLLEGMTGAQRRPIAEGYWRQADPSFRHGPRAETFLEFEARVSGFITELPTLPDRTVLFGHGIWLGLLCWKLLGFSALDAQGMQAFRLFQTALPVPNGAVYTLERTSSGGWHLQVDERLMRRLTGCMA